MPQCNHILSLLDKGHSATHIASTTGLGLSTISCLCSKHCSTLSKSLGGHPTKLSVGNIKYATHLITSCKAENASQITRTLHTIINQPLSSKMVCRALKKAGMKAVAKQKRPKLSVIHKRKRLEWAEAHAD